MLYLNNNATPPPPRAGSYGAFLHTRMRQCGLYPPVRLTGARGRQHGEAPYKPALQLAVLEGIDDGSIQHNRIYITPELLAASAAP